MGKHTEPNEGQAISDGTWKNTFERCLKVFDELSLNRIEVKLPYGQFLPRHPLERDTVVLPVGEINLKARLKDYEQMKLIIYHDPGIRRSILLEQKLHCEVLPGAKINPKPGFFYKIKPKRGVIIRKVIASKRSTVLDNMMQALITECNRVFLMYCNELPGK